MRSWLNEIGLLLCALVALTITTGCRSGGNLDMIEREIRWKEDRIYYLEDSVREYKQRLESARRENETLRRELEDSRGGADTWSPGAGGTAPPPLPPSSSGPSGLPPVGGGDSGRAPGLDGAPIISPPGEGVPEGIEVNGDEGSGLPAPSFDDSTGADSTGADSSFDAALPDDAPSSALSADPVDDEQPIESMPSFAPASQSERAEPEELLPTPPPFKDTSYRRQPHESIAPSTTPQVAATYPLPTDEDQVAKVTLNSLLTGGHDTSDGPGDEGVLVVVEPRNAADEIIDVGGTVEIALVDPAATGTAREVARWRFAPDETVERFRETILGAGMYFDLPWPNRPPTHSKLQLHVRYTTPEGQKFDLSDKIEVDPPSAAATADGHDSTEGHAQALPPRAVDGPASGAKSRERMARIGRPIFRHGDGQHGATDPDAAQPRPSRQRDTQLSPPAWTPYR